MVSNSSRSLRMSADLTWTQALLGERSVRDCFEQLETMIELAAQDIPDDPVDGSTARAASTRPMSSEISVHVLQEIAI